MFRNTALKATHSGMLGGATSSCRRSFHLASTARSASKRAGSSLTARRPLAVLDRAGVRHYASSAEGPKMGVVSYNTNLNRLRCSYGVR